jgi:hypothetical protein
MARRPKRGAVGCVSGTRGTGRLLPLAPQNFRFGDVVEAVQGDPLDVDALADHFGGHSGVAQSQCQRVWQQQPA